MDVPTMEDIISKATEKTLKLWRECGKPDDQILRDKLIECGWKYKRTAGGVWYHPEAPGLPAPAKLHDLAAAICAVTVKDLVESHQ